MRLGPALLLAPLLALAGARSLHADDGPVAPPAPPSSGPGSLATPFPSARHETFDGPLAAERKVHVYRPDGPSLPASAPVVLFAHGFGASGPAGYEAWLEHIAKQGVLVVFPVYPAIDLPGGATRYDALWAGFEEALRRLDHGDGPKPDRTRMGFLGHSFGGGAAPPLAARAAARGFGSKALWIECFAPWYDLDRAAWAVLPPHALLVTVGYADDDVCDFSIASGFRRLATTIPEERKAFFCFRSDAHGKPALKAGHLAPLSTPSVDAFDTHGGWRLDDALRAYALTGDEKAGALALSSSPEALSLGAWSDGRPVAPLVTAPEPPPPGLHLRGPSWRPGGKREEAMRTLLAAEAYSGLPLPPPALAKASHLGAAERFVGEVPALSPRLLERAKEGPILVVGAVPEGSPEAAVLARLTAAGKVRVVAVLPTEDDLARAFARPKTPTAVLVARGGKPLLWKPLADEAFPAAVEDLLAPR